MRKVRLDTLKNYRGPPERGQTRRCDHAGCKKAGEYRAPKSRRQLKDYYYFCLDHVQAYNKAWNYHAGMSAEEIERHMHAAVLGERPRWAAKGNGRFIPRKSRWPMKFSRRRRQKSKKPSEFWKP